MVDNSGRMDARLATHMGMTEVLDRDEMAYKGQTEGSGFDSNNGHNVETAKVSLRKKFYLDAARIEAFITGCATIVMLLVIYNL